MLLPEYDHLDGVALSDLVRKREIEPQEVLDAAIERIEMRNPRLNAVVTKIYDYASRQLAKGLPDAPLAGAPILLKDERADVAGVVTGNGSSLFDGICAEQDAEIVKRYRAAGLLILGKTNLPELGISVATESVRHGPARNPWDISLTAGGSSGGSAVAVAARMAPIGHGTDAGGSIRIPAAFCGLFGFKPTRARISSGPAHGEAWGGMTNEHALTRSVRDSAALLDASCGPATGDPYFPPPPLRSFRDEVDRDPPTLRIGLCLEAPSGEPLAPEIIAATERSAAMLEALGHQIVPLGRPPFDKTAFDNAFRLVACSFMGATLRAVERRIGRALVKSDLEQMTWEVYQEAQAATGIEFAENRALMHAIGRTLAAWCDQVDIVLTPTVGIEPFEVGLLDPTRADIFDRLWGVMRGMNPFCMIANTTGRPAMSAPLEQSARGLPIGIHFIGRYADEALLFRLAGQLERAHPWADRRPPFLEGLA